MADFRFWTWPEVEVTILGPDQKERGLWAREWLKFKQVLWVVSHVTKRHWLLRKREGMRHRKLVGSRQRSLSSRFSLSRRERPLLAGKYKSFTTS